MALDGTLEILWIGARSGEFVAARESLDEFRGVKVIEQPDVHAAAQWLIEQLSPPMLVVVAQSRPGEIGAAEIDRLRRTAPLARLVGLLGTWCEGEARSGKPWPAVERVYWHQWPQWIRRQRQAFASGRGGGWSLPPTATPEERLLAGANASFRVPLAGLHEDLVAIVSPRPAIAEMLSQAAGRAGFRSICTAGVPSQLSGLSLAIWDGDRCGPAEASRLQALAAAVRPAPLVALLTFPRLEECQRATAAGAVKILSKPVCLDRLFARV